MTQVGTRVIALEKADLIDGTYEVKDGQFVNLRYRVYSYGEGIYVGDEEPPDYPIGKNPKIELDNGEVVWGHQCWWGPVEKVRGKYGPDSEWIAVSVPEKGENCEL